MDHGERGQAVGARDRPEREKLVEACERGGASLFGTGVSPRFVDMLGLVMAGISDRIDKITVSEAAHAVGYDSPETEKPAGFGRPLDDPKLPAMTAERTAVFGEAVEMMTEALGIELDEVTCEAEYAAAFEELDLGSWRIGKGCVAGIAASRQGRVDGRAVVELNVRWNKAPVLEPDWTIEDGWEIEVQGRPTVRPRVQFLPPADFEATSLAGFMVLGHIMTAMPAVNAIPGVVAAPPRVLSVSDLPAPIPRGLVRSGSLSDAGS